MMKFVHVSWKNDADVEVGISGDLNEAAVSDLIKVIETMDGDEEYEPGMVLDFRDLRQ